VTGSWHQAKTPNLGVTYTGGMCLEAVADAFGTPHVYPSAMADWLSGEPAGDYGSGHNHHEAPPTGVSVPVYFSLGDEPAGHIAISLPDRRVASSTQNGTHKGLYIHPNMADLIRIYAEYHKTCIYLGWSEGTENTAIVTWTPDTSTGGTDMDSKEIARGLYRVLIGPVPSDDIIAQKADYMDKAGNIDQVATDLRNINWVGKDQLASTKAQMQAVIDQETAQYNTAAADRDKAKGQNVVDAKTIADQIQQIQALKDQIKAIPAPVDPIIPGPTTDTPTPAPQPKGCLGFLFKGGDNT
jgi:hypothetical protein